MGAASASIVDPLLQLLKSLHSDVQHEGDFVLSMFKTSKTPIFLTIIIFMEWPFLYLLLFINCIL